jgi:flagellar biosynthesis component FlhA
MAEKEDEYRISNILSFLEVLPITLEIGRGLISIVDPSQREDSQIIGATKEGEHHEIPIETMTVKGLLSFVGYRDGTKLMERIKALRRHIAIDLGIVVPSVRFRDNLQLRQNAYAIKIREEEVGRGEVQPDRVLAIGNETQLARLGGDIVADPIYGMPGTWISRKDRSDAEIAGCVLFDAVSVIATHLTDAIFTHASRLIGHQELQVIVDSLSQKYPAVVRYVTHRVPLAQIKMVLQNLLNEMVSIRDLIQIFEIMAEHIHMFPNTDAITEVVRKKLSRRICRRFATPQGDIPAITMDSGLERLLCRKVHRTRHSILLRISEKTLGMLTGALEAAVMKSYEFGSSPVLIAPDEIRLPLSRMLKARHRHLIVLSKREIAAEFYPVSCFELRMERSITACLNTETVGRLLEETRPPAYSTSHLSLHEKVAAILSVLTPDSATSVLNHLSESLFEKISSAIGQMPQLDDIQRLQCIDEFLSRFGIRQGRTFTEGAAVMEGIARFDALQCARQIHAFTEGSADAMPMNQ